MDFRQPLDNLLAIRLFIGCKRLGIPDRYLDGTCPYFLPKRVKERWNTMHFVNQYQAVQAGWNVFMHTAWAR